MEHRELEVASKPKEHAHIEELQVQMATSMQKEESNDFMFLVGNLVDDSASIHVYRNTDAVIEGHNAHIENIIQKARGDVLVMTRFMNAGTLFDYSKPEKAVKLDRRNYFPIQGTPLYDQSTTFLREKVLPVATLLQAEGKKVFTFNTIFSDGEDTVPRLNTLDDARRVVEQMLEMKNHIIAAICVEGDVDPYKIFRSMGIPEQWIKVIPRSDKEIVRGFTAASNLTMGASMSEVDFTKTSVTGFDVKRFKRKP